MRDFIMSAARRLLYPFPGFPWPTGSLASKLDAVAERAGLGTVEDVFRDNPAMDRIVRAMTRFLDDPDAVLVLKKSFHIALENRLRLIAVRADPPENNRLAPIDLPAADHPLDILAYEILQRTLQPIPLRKPNVGIGSRARHLMSVVFEGGAVLSVALSTLVRYGKRHIEPRAFRVGSPDMQGEGYWAAVVRALEHEGLMGDDALVFIDESHAGFYPGNGLELVCPATLPVARRRWCFDAVLPAFRLFGSVFWTALRFAAVPQIVEAARASLFEARKGLAIWRITHNFHFRFYIDIAEYTATHIVKRIIFSKVGTRMVRWPFCVIDGPGAILSYLCYDLFLGTGPYELNYSKTWSSRFSHHAVGFFKNDRHFGLESSPASEIEERVSEHISKGGRVAVWFGPSALPGLEPMVCASLEAMIRVLGNRENWLLIVKTKSYKNYELQRQLFTTLPGIAEMEAKGSVLIVRYLAPRDEICPAGWLIRKMDFGVGIGTVQQESLTQGKPGFSYFPVIQDTPCQRKLIEAGLAHDDPEGLKRALEKWVANPGGFAIPFDWFRENFDPFADDRALSRIAHILWGAGLTSPEREAARGDDDVAVAGEQLAFSRELVQRHLH